MRIAVDARELAATPTGVGRYLQELLDAWTADPAAADCTVVLVTPAAVPERRWAGPGARVTIQVAAGLPGTLWEQVTLPRAVRGTADVLFCPAYAAPLLSPVPTVVAVHDVSYWAHPEWFGAREGLRRRWTTRLSARRAARVLTISAFSRDEIVRWLGVPPPRIVVTHLGASSRLAQAQPEAPPSSGDRRTILYVGTYLNRRHLPDLVRGFAPVARRHASARLVLVGENRTFPREDPAAVARAEGVAAQVECRPWVSDAELAALYAEAAVFAFLSTYEGFGLTPLEAMAAGIPVVAYDTAVAREIYGTAAILVRAGDLPALTCAFETLLTDPAEHERLAGAGRAHAAGFSWGRAAALTLDVLRSVAG
jgi:glycosyltransferase involved in cell wall biosynthesis